MDVKELRVGNWINEYGAEIEVAYLSWDDKSEGCSGIPLTEEWLLKFGFVKEELTIDGNSSYKKVFYFLGTNKEDFVEGLYWDNDEMTGYEHVKHVHTLQNLYFALTGEELTIR